MKNSSLLAALIGVLILLNSCSVSKSQTSIPGSTPDPEVQIRGTETIPNIPTQVVALAPNSTVEIEVLLDQLLSGYSEDRYAAIEQIFMLNGERFIAGYQAPAHGTQFS